MKLPFDLRALWDRALTWYRSHGERDRRIILGVLVAVGLSLVYLGVRRADPRLPQGRRGGDRLATMRSSRSR